MKFKRSQYPKKDADIRKILGLSWCWDEELQTIYDDNIRVIVKDATGSIMFDGSKFLFKECFKKGIFIEI